MSSILEFYSRLSIHILNEKYLDPDRINKKYIDITELIQKEFSRNVSKYGGKIRCSKGCSQCCSQIFRITKTDAHFIQKHMKHLPEDIRNNIKDKAKNYLAELSSKKDEANSNNGEYFSKPKMNCPALDEDGACMIYEGRPVICRRFGPPVYDYKNPGNLFACELNFINGEEIIDDELIPSQTIIGANWDELKTEFNIENGLNENASTTIAEAILNS